MRNQRVGQDTAAAPVMMMMMVMMMSAFGVAIASLHGIHGTDAPATIGHAQSHGCIRLRNRDVERLFEQVRAGDLVEIR